MGIQLNGNNDNISAVDGDLSITGIVTFSQLDVGNNIKLGNAGVITATSFSGDGSNLTGISASSDKIIEGNTKAEVVDTGSDGHFKIETEGVRRFRVISTGETVIDDVDLIIGSGQNTQAQLNFFSNQDNASGRYSRIRKNYNSPFNFEYFASTSNSHQSHVFYSDLTTERVRINSTGNMSLGGIDPVPTSTQYNTASFHIHQKTNATNVGAQIHLTTANKGSAAGDGSQVSQYNGSLYINNQDDGDTYFYNNGSPTATIKANGSFGIGTQSPADKLVVNGTTDFKSNSYIGGDLYMYGNSYSGKGIFLGGSTSANKLDDYEEGEWNPTYVSMGGSSGSVSYTNQMGYYVKIGHTVWVCIDMTIANASGMTGNAAIGNHPFNSNPRGSGSIYYYSGSSNWYIQNHSENKPIFTGWMPANTNVFRIHNGNNWGNLPNAPLNTTGRLSFSHWYTTDS